MTIRLWIHPKIKFVVATVVVTCSIILVAIVFLIPVTMVCFAQWWNEEPVEFFKSFAKVVGEQNEL